MNDGGNEPRAESQTRASGTITGVARISRREATRELVRASGMRQLTWVFAGMAFALAALSWTFQGREGLSTCLPMLFLGLMLLLMSNAQSRVIKKLPGDDASTPITSFELDSTGYSTSSSLASSRVAWSMVTRYVELDSSFVIFSQPSANTVMPKRAFLERDLEAIRQLLKVRVAMPKTAPSRRRVIVLWVLLILAFGAIWMFLNSEEPPAAPAPRGHAR